MLTKRIIPCIDVDVDEDGNAAVYTGVNFEDLTYTGDTLVDGYGGEVRVEDNDPRGTVFSVELPLAE